MRPIIGQAGLHLPGPNIVNKAPLKRDSSPRTPGMNRLLYHLAIHGCCSCLSRHSFKFVRGVSPRYSGFQPDAPQLELTDLQGTAVCVFLSKTPRRAHDFPLIGAPEPRQPKPNQPTRQAMAAFSSIGTKCRCGGVIGIDRFSRSTLPYQDRKAGIRSQNCCGHLLFCQDASYPIGSRPFDPRMRSFRIVGLILGGSAVSVFRFRPVSPQARPCNRGAQIGVPAGLKARSLLS